MKKSQLQQIIKEELSSVLKEYAINSLNISKMTQGYGNPIDPNIFAKMMPKTAKTADMALNRLKSFEGQYLGAHVQNFIVKPNGNQPNMPTFQIGETQIYAPRPYLKSEEEKKINVSMLLISDKTTDKRLGYVFVDTDVFLQELKTVYTIVKKMQERSVNEGNDEASQMVANTFNSMGLAVVNTDANMSGGIQAPSIIVTFKDTFDKANKMNVVNDYNDNKEEGAPEIIGADVVGSNKVKFYFKPNR